MSALRMVVISDTHGRHEGWTVPDGDVLVHAGDLTKRGTLAQISEAADFLRALPHAHKVVIAGNHDFGFQREPEQARALMDGLLYLEDEAAEICGVRFFGSPWQPTFFDWAFNLPRGVALAERWAAIPEDTDVLVTHGPPLGVLDEVAHPVGDRVGCADLLERVRAIRPAVHCFGHIHESAGVVHADGTTFVNASICDLRYRPTLPPRVLELRDGAWSVQHRDRGEPRR